MTDEKLKNWQLGDKTSHTLAFFVFHWRAFVCSGDEHHLHKARYKVLTDFETNQSDVRLGLAAVFLHMATGNFDMAQELLNRIAPYRNYYKITDIKTHLVLNYLLALNELKRDKMKAALKYYRVIEEYAQSDKGFVNLLLGSLKIQLNDVAEGFVLLEKSNANGCNSVFLFLNVLTALTQKQTLEGNHPLLLRFINWGTNQNLALESLMDHYEQNMENFDIEQVEAAKKVYETHPKEWLLKAICQHHVAVADESLGALRYYKEALNKQVQIPEMNSRLVRTAFRHNVETLSRFSVRLFLKVDMQSKSVGVALKAFLYHVILTHQKFEDIAEQLTDEMINFAFYCLENNMKSRYINSVYALALLRSEEKNLPESYVLAIEKTLEPHLFEVEVTVKSPLVSLIWVVEDAQKDATAYSVSDGACVIKATSDLVQILCFSQEAMQFIKTETAQTKTIENADINLALYYYRKKRLSPELLIMLSHHIIALDKPTEESIDVLTDTLNLSQISFGFKMQVSAALGNVLYARDRYDKALEYYNGVDENYLNDQCIEQMLRVFVDMGEIEKAVVLINKKSHCIADRTLFQALKKVAAVGTYNAFIADVAYELMLKSWHDKVLLNIVLTHYKGSQQEWQELSKTLAVISASEEALDSIIIKNSVWMHCFDMGTQKVFGRMFEHTPENECVKLFTYYCIYEIIVNAVKPEYDTIAIMEKIFLQKEEPLLGYALCTIYLEKSISTRHSDDIIEQTLETMEKAGLLLPIFKNSKDKKFETAYIVKNQPFIYRCEPNQEVFVYYKVDNDTQWSTCKMTYLRFGIYTAKVTHFYAEKMTYYFCEEMQNGSIITKETQVMNNKVYLMDTSVKAVDGFFTINNALVYEQMFKYEQVEAIITEALEDHHVVKGCLL